jgi:hypothetical protein
MLDAVMPHAGGEDAMPALEAVLFEVRGGTLYLAATDRYSMGIARCRIPGARAAPVADATALLPLRVTGGGLLPMLERADGTAALVFGEDSLTVDTGSASATYKTDSHPEHFPDWRPLLAGILAGEAAELGDARGIAPLHLAKFAAGPDDTPGYCETGLRVRILSPTHRKGVLLHSGEHEPVVLLARGDWFLGALMPMRVDREAAPEVWAEWAAVTAPAEELAPAVGSESHAGPDAEMNPESVPENGDHECSFPCNPPGGFMRAPGSCSICGKTWDRAQAEKALAEAQSAMAGTEKAGA